MHVQLKPFPIEDNTGDQAPSPAKTTKRTRKAPWLISTAAAVLIVGLVGGWRLYEHASTHTAPQVTSSARQHVTVTGQSSNGTTSYVSNGTDLNLSVAYPSGWTASPPSNDNAADLPITITSPISDIPGATNGMVTGKVVVSIRPASSQLDELAPGAAMATQASTQFAYTAPTASQHQYPYLTFIHLAGGTDTAGAFDEVIISGVIGFSAGQNITAGSLGTLDPIISARFYGCATTACTGSSESALTITNTTWQDTPLLQQVQALFASLQLH